MSNTRTMQALRAHARGGHEKLELEQAPLPVPARHEVLIAVDAAAITNGELGWDLSWHDLDGNDRTPIIPAHEVAGRVVAVGGGDEDFALGDQVYGIIPFDRDGAAAEFVTVPTTTLAPAPLTVGPVHAAALPLAALTAWQALFIHGSVSSGDRVLIHGAGGGVGVYVVQLAAGVGAKVTVTAAAAEEQFVRALGADDVIDYQHQSFDELVSDVDLVIDTVGGKVLEQSYGVLRRGGRLVTLSGPPDQKMAEQHGVDARFFVVEPDRALLAHLASMVDDEDLRSVVSQTFPLADGRAAYESLAGTRPPGKTVLLVDVDDGTQQQ